MVQKWEAVEYCNAAPEGNITASDSKLVTNLNTIRNMRDSKTWTMRSKVIANSRRIEFCKPLAVQS